MKKIKAMVLASATLVLSGTALADASYPNKPIRLIVPYAAGGGTDVIARKISHVMSEVLKQSIVVDNKPGAGTAIAAADLAKSAPDGYTVLWGDNSTYVVNQFLYKNLSYSPSKSFAPVGVTVKGGLVLSVNAAIPANNVQEFIQYAKANPGKLAYGTPGNGTPHHLMMEGFKKAAGGLDIQHAPYKGEGPAMNELVGGSLQTMFSGARVGVSTASTGKIKNLAFSGLERNKATPGVPTFAEAGFPNFVNEYWHGLSVPAGTPAAVIDKLNAALKTAVQNPELLDWLHTIAGVRAIASTPAEMRTLMETEAKTTGELLKSLDLQIN